MQECFDGTAGEGFRERLGQFRPTDELHGRSLTRRRFDVYGPCRGRRRSPGLPPAFVTAYQIDPTRDEGLDHARKLIQAGVPTEVHHYAEAFHIAHVIPGTAIGSRMIGDRIKAIRRLLRV